MYKLCGVHIVKNIHMPTRFSAIVQIEQVYLTILQSSFLLINVKVNKLYYTLQQCVAECVKGISKANTFANNIFYLKTICRFFLLTVCTHRDEAFLCRYFCSCLLVVDIEVYKELHMRVSILNCSIEQCAGRYMCSHCDSKRAAMFIASHFVKSTLNGNKFQISFYVPFSSAPFLFSYFSSLLSHFAIDSSSILPFQISVSYDSLHSTSCLILYRILLHFPILLLLALYFPIS